MFCGTLQWRVPLFLFSGRPGAPLSAVIKENGILPHRDSAENGAEAGKAEPECASLTECAEENRRKFSGAEQITGKWLNCDISRFVARAHFVPFGSSTASVYVRRMYMNMESLQDARAEEVRLFLCFGERGASCPGLCEHRKSQGFGRCTRGGKRDGKGRI